MRWYPEILASLKDFLPGLRATQQVNLALLVSALLQQRTCNLTELARAYPSPKVRRVRRPKHDLLHRLKRLWRFLDNARIDPAACQLEALPRLLACLGSPRTVLLSLDWTFFTVTTIRGRRIAYQMLRVAIPWKGRALPVLQVAYPRDQVTLQQNRLEEAWLGRVLEALPPGTRVVVLADRGFARATFLEWLQARGVDFVVRIDRGTVITDREGRRLRLGEEGLQPGERSWWPQVRYGLHHGRPRDLWLNVLGVWEVRPQASRGKAPEEAWYLASSLPHPGAVFRQYWLRGWIEQSFKDSKSSIFGLHRVRIEAPERLNRLLLALTLALAWLVLWLWRHPELLRWPWTPRLVVWGRLSFTRLALAALDLLADDPPP